MLGTLSALTVIATARFADAVRDRLDSDDRRLREVERDPRLATHDDIEALVRAHGVSEAKVWAVCDRLASADLDPTTVWSWTMAYDGNELADLCDGALTDAEVGAYLDQRTSPSYPAVRVA